MDSKVILFDTETTGTGEEDRVLQVALASILTKDVFSDTTEMKVVVCDEMCKPPLKIKSDAMEVHHITEEMVKDLPLYANTMFAKQIEKDNKESNYLVAHNIQFDLAMIAKEGFSNKYKIIDTLQCAKHLLPDELKHRLQYLRYEKNLYQREDTIMQSFGIKEIKAHDAISDVVTLFALFEYLLSCNTLKKLSLENEEPLDTLHRLTSTPALIKTMPFGKYKGKNISVVKEDSDYVRWLINNMELEYNLKATLLGEI